MSLKLAHPKLTAVLVIALANATCATLGQAVPLRIAMLCHLQDTKPNFSGTWSCEYCAKGGERDHIEHEEPLFTISEEVGRADIVYSITFKTDGTDQGPKAADLSRIAHWEGNTLVLERKWNDRGAVSMKREELSLSGDGKTMTKHVHTSGRIGTSHNYFLEFKKASEEKSNSGGRQ